MSDMISRLFGSPVLRRTIRSHTLYRALVELVPVSSDQIDSWLEERRIFFIVSTGRTGTKWLSQLLGRFGDAHVVHEPVPYEQFAHASAANDEQEADEYIRKFRRKEIYLRVGGTSPEVYGEVNGALRRHVKPLAIHIPHAKIIHLVRDGRDVIRSVMSRGTYAGQHPVYRSYTPRVVDQYSERWAELSEFEKTAWTWRVENEWMRKHTSRTARFEDITSSFEAFQAQILAPLGLRMDPEAWSASVARPINSTTTYSVGSWADWPESWRRQFVEICGAEMAEYGYTCSDGGV